MTRIVSYAVVLALLGCSDGDRLGALPTTVKDSLELLGVPTDESPRLSNDSMPLPDDFAPLGQILKIAIDADGKTHIGAPLELIVGGAARGGAAEPFSVIDNPQVPDAGGAIPVAPIYALTRTEAPWIEELTRFEKEAPTTRRDAAAGDLDGDGYDDLVVAHATPDEVLVQIANLADRTKPEEMLVVPVPAEVLPAADVRVQTADVDRDGHAELIVAASQAAAPGRGTATALLVLSWTPGSLTVRFSRTFSSTLQNLVHATTVLQPGNIDYDGADELVLVLNEFVGTQEIPSQASTRFVILDDASMAFAELAAGALTVETDATIYVAQVADVALGDLDGDYVNEIVFGGLADLTVARTCNTDGSGGTGSLRYLLSEYEFDGLTISHTTSAASSDDDASSLYPGYCAGSAGGWALRFLDVDVLDFDGDRKLEVRANQFVFRGIPEPGWQWFARADFTLPQGVLFPDQNATLAFDRNTSRIISNDIDGDGRADIVSYRGGDSAIRIFSWRQPILVSGEPAGPPELYQRALIPMTATVVGRSVNPMLVMLDADGLNEGDVQTLRYVKHDFALTEPLVLAAIAAPPCLEGAGQNTDACTSSWGNAEVTGTEAEHEVEFKAGIVVGFEAEYEAGVGFVVQATTKVFGVSAKVELAETLGRHKSEAYEVSRSVTFETGPLEDSVVFSSIPYDFYTYEVIAAAHVTTADLGAEREIQRLGLPRTPIIRMAQTAYYNSHTTASATKIDSAVFGHTVGRLDSYPDRFDRDEILSLRRTQIEALRAECPGCWRINPDAPLISGNTFRRQFDPRSALPGLVSDAVGVGQGSGSTEVAIDFSRSTSFARSLEKSAELGVEFTIGYAVLGFVVGRSSTWTTTITQGASTAYVGSVGSIDAAHFATNQYRFGMFTYLQGDGASGQEFEVINYWVE